MKLISWRFKKYNSPTSSICGGIYLMYLSTKSFTFTFSSSFNNEKNSQCSEIWRVLYLDWNFQILRFLSLFIWLKLFWLARSKYHYSMWIINIPNFLLEFISCLNKFKQSNSKLHSLQKQSFFNQWSWSTILWNIIVTFSIICLFYKPHFSFQICVIAIKTPLCDAIFEKVAFSWCNFFFRNVEDYSIAELS